MTFPNNPDDRPDPMENMPAVRARIPEHVAKGEISTGVIVVTGPTEYVLDFVRNLPRPNCIVARVVLTHLVMPQFIDALSTNVQMFRNRYGELPGASIPPTPVGSPQQDAGDSPDGMNSPAAAPSEHGTAGNANHLDLNAPLNSPSSGPVHLVVQTNRPLRMTTHLTRSRSRSIQVLPCRRCPLSRTMSPNGRILKMSMTT